MTHEETQELIDAYADGELDVVTSREVERHLQSCAECRALEQNVRALRDLLQKSSPAYRAPASLRRKVQAALPNEERFASTSFFRSLALAAACLVLLWGGWQIVQRNQSAHELADEVVASHVRSLLASHLV